MRSIKVFIAFSAVLTVWCVPEYRIECGVWRNVTDRLNSMEDVRMQCDKNVQCTGFDCSGLYEYKGLYSLDHEISFTYCFGVAVHPCHDPVDLHVYVDIPDQNIHFQQNVENTTDIQIPGFHYEISAIGKVDGFIHVDMTDKTIDGHPYVEIGVVFKVRVQGTIAIIGEWPESLQQTMMPLMDVPIPMCEPAVITPTHVPNTCVKYTTVAPKTTTKNGKASTASYSFPYDTVSIGAISCTPNKAFECSEAMMCDIERHICVCNSDSEYSPTGCQPVAKQQSNPPYILPRPADTTIVPASGKRSYNLSHIIIGVSLTCVVIVVGLVGGVLFYKYRKHQERYGNHQPLINNEEEEDDDDDPIDVST